MSTAIPSAASWSMCCSFQNPASASAISGVAGDPGVGELALGRGDHRLKRREVDRLGRDLGGEHDLMLVDDRLRVVALHIAFWPFITCESGSVRLTVPCGLEGGW